MAPPSSSPTAPSTAAGTPAAGPLPKASVADTLGVTLDVLVPLVARGVVARRPRVVDAAQRTDADRRAVQRMQRLRRRYGPGPVVLRLPLRTMAVVLDPADVHRVLQASPEPFSPATREKRAALSQFQPHGVLISDPAQRAERRPFNEGVLGTHDVLHPMADQLTAKVVEEADELVAVAASAGVLRWDDFITAWWRAVRRVVLGDAARDDHALTDMLTSLRHSANWSYLRPTRRDLRARFTRQLEGHLRRAEPGSLAELVASLPAGPDTDRAQQVPQWLFAFDPAGMATIRALALLVAHPDAAARVREEVAAHPLSSARELPRLRAAVLESLRLWPTTPAVLRETTATTTWTTGVLPAGASLVLFAPLFHRDDETLPYAHRFAPGIWEADRGEADWPLIPFSGGPGMCPGRNLVLLTTSTMLAVLLSRLALVLPDDAPLSADRPLRGTLSPYALRFGAAPLRAS